MTARTIARVKTNGDLYIAGNLYEAEDSSLSFDADGNLYTNDFSEISDIPAVMRFLDGVKLSGEIVEGRIGNPIQDGLILHYDFSQKDNDSRSREIVDDLSKNGDYGELQNFAFEKGSGYESDGLKFDGVDDYIHIGIEPLSNDNDSFTIIVLTEFFDDNRYICQNNWSLQRTMFSTRGRDSLAVHFPIQTVGLAEQAVTYSGDGENKTLIGYKNGVYTGTHSKEGSPITSYREDDLVAGKTHHSGGRHSRNLIKSIKIYNRALTEKEIKYNYELEKARWGL